MRRDGRCGGGGGCHRSSESARLLAASGGPPFESPCLVARPCRPNTPPASFSRGRSLCAVGCLHLGCAQPRLEAQFLRCPPVMLSARTYDEKPILLFWEMTKACPLACAHCRAQAQHTPMPGELSTEEAKRFLDDVTGFGSPSP